MAINHWKKYNLDAIYVATNAPGRSAFNRVERRMAPLSRDLAGLVLPHDHFGSHLDDQCRTVDEELEKINFEHAGKVLAEIWSETVIDKYKTIAEYVSPDANQVEDDIEPATQEWRRVHVREGHYFLQASCTYSTSNILYLTNYNFTYL